MPLYVTNATDKTIYLRSFDGDSVGVHPKSRRVKVSKKFDWQAPSGKGIRIEDGGPDLVDPNRIVRPRAMPEPKTRPKGHHNKSRQEAMSVGTTKEYYAKVAKINEVRAAKIASQQAAIDAKFSRSHNKK
jgi:hypothetical protein